MKSENNVKKRPAIKNHVGKSHDEDELVPMAGNKVPKIPRSKKRPATYQSPRKRVKQNERVPNESTDEEENTSNYSSDDN